MDENDYKEYLALAKQYQKQYEKQVREKQPQKQQHEQHHEQTLGNEYSKKIPEKPLIAEEIDALFWGKLVQLGWRTDSNPLLESVDSTAKVTRFVYVCKDCDLPLHAENAIKITPSKAKNMCNLELLKEKLFQHKKMARECRPVEETE